MTRWILVAAVVSGCFYPDTLDEPPSVAIVDQPTAPVFRNDSVTLGANPTSPLGNAVSVRWQVYACTDASDQFTGCDNLPFDSDTTMQTTFVVPPNRADTGTPTLAVLVLLDGEDDFGAVAQQQELVIAVSDHPPVLTLAQSSAHDYVVGSHIILDADVTDLDDPPAGDTVVWSVETPVPNATYTLSAPTIVTSTATDVTYRSELVADVIGTWTVQVTATDPLSATDEQDFVLAIGSDLPPCITAPSPIASSGDVLPLLEPTLFEVPIVIDDLDVYPPSQSGDPDLGVATFHWSIEQPGETTFTPLAVTANSMPLDPATYAPGDVVQLRVEAHDRIDRDAEFAACGSAATCTLNLAEPTCLQRITWTVEVP